MHRYANVINPYLGDLLERMDMAKRFVRGEGCWLYDDAGVRYLDFVAAYGALPFGFNPPEIWQAIQGVQASGEPSFVQPSDLQAAGELAERLIELAPGNLRYVTFANSGAEAAEAAIKAARAATGRRAILSTHGGFHGKTMAALSATGRAKYQEAFGLPLPDFDRVPFGDLAALEALLAEHPDRYAAFLVEPIQGEGGIVIPPAGYLRGVQEVCRKYGVAFILDEVQTGLGRTGSLFAASTEGLEPDAIMLAKALGGGLMPIAAVLTTAELFSYEFGMRHSSTFGGNTLACRAGLAALDLLTKDDGALLRHVTEVGSYLTDGLRDIGHAYPHLVGEVRGRGLMIGVDFCVDRDTFPGRLVGVLAEQETLSPLIASRLLNVGRLRVAPTLNGASVIRVEPPLIVTKAECDYAFDAFQQVLEDLKDGHTGAMLQHVLSIPAERIQPVPRPAPRNEPTPSPGDGEGHFAFLIHPVSTQNYPEFDESLACYSDADLAKLAAKFNDMIDPFVMSTMRLRTPAGKQAYGEFITVPNTAEQFLEMPHKDAIARIQAAIDLAVSRGAKIVGLGAYTSVVTRGGHSLRNIGVPLTTGNSYTVVSAVEAVWDAVRRLDLSLPSSVAAVVGATGAIGRACSILLSEEISQLILVGNPARPEQSRRRLVKVAAEALRHLASQAQTRAFPAGTVGAYLAAMGDRPAADASLDQWIAFAEEFERATSAVVISTDIDAVLPQADVVVTATSSLNDLITPENVKFGAVVCDLSRPPNVSRDMKDARPDVLVIDGGVVELPGRPSLGWNFGFEEGMAYACMSETMLLALEQHYEDVSIGADLNLETVLWLRSLGIEHGFRLADLRSFDRPLSPEDWERTGRARTAELNRVPR